MLFRAACATVVGVPLRPITKEALVVSDTLNHSNIINVDRVSSQEDVF
jgi:hypothetical protein